MPASESDTTSGSTSGIVWLASYPKSGNTWTRTFLHNLFGSLEGKAAAHDINDINEFTTWDLAAKRYEPHLGKPVTSASRAEIAAARPRVQEEIAVQAGGLTLVKTHHALVMDRGHPTINFAVTSGAIYLVRNPLDVVISFAHHMGCDIDTAIEQMALEGMETDVSEKSVYEVYGSWGQHVRSWTAKPHRAICVIRYEDLLERPFETFARIARHLLLSPTPEQMDEAIDRSSFARLRAQEEEHGFREKPDAAQRFFREGRAGQWRERLSRRQVRRIVEAHAPEMSSFGYLSDDIRHFAR
ncbi:MAG: sulfotransferase domain-containing protein [Parvibaculum sp.]|uniref:sulfotransferase domain-containing protein n=1 Tax=Parvibaculum sp. TaxID=2024848 RepID=UPI00284B3EA6|nr:sulfotransferase domain-containing protein [Parvibaculum sp.]MDR3499865.1 sulfotransferase domain-containing protein [Parvibaculum sp.]